MNYISSFSLVGNIQNHDLITLNKKVVENYIFVITQAVSY